MVLHVEVEGHLVLNPLTRGLVKGQPNGSVAIECLGLDLDLDGADVGIAKADFASNGAVSGELIKIEFEIRELRAGKENFGIAQTRTGDADLACEVGRSLKDLYRAGGFAPLESDGRESMAYGFGRGHGGVGSAAGEIGHSDAELVRVPVEQRNRFIVDWDEVLIALQEVRRSPGVLHVGACVEANEVGVGEGERGATPG